MICESVLTILVGQATTGLYISQSLSYREHQVLIDYTSLHDE